MQKSYSTFYTAVKLFLLVNYLATHLHDGVNGFYVPGVAPQDFKEGAPVEVKVIV